MAQVKVILREDIPRRDTLELAIPYHIDFAKFIAVCSCAKTCAIGENLLSISDVISRPQERLIHAGPFCVLSWMPREPEWSA